MFSNFQKRFIADMKKHTTDRYRITEYPLENSPDSLPLLARVLRSVFLYAWAFPNTCIGIPFVFMALCPGGNIRMGRGVVELSSPLISGFLKHCIPVVGGASAMTLGHIIIGRDPESLDSARIHELVHVHQCEKWGPFFIPAYFAATFIAFCKGRDPYLGNIFEREAYEKEAEYQKICPENSWFI